MNSETLELVREGVAVPRVTLQTLAGDLGVSRATVSNAFSRPDQLSSGLRERILARARELGFAGPDPAARGLRRGRVGAVGVLIDQGLSYAFSDPATVVYLDGLARELQAGGFGLLLHAGTDASEDLDLVRSAAVDAWVVASLPRGHPAVRAAQAQGRPIVVFDQPELAGVPMVRIDDAAGTALAARHLLALGHRRFGVLTMALRADGYQGVADVARQEHATYSTMQSRMAGVRSEITAAGLAWADVVVVECATNTVDTGALATWELLERTGRPSAVIAFSDQLAAGALLAARELGIAVPADLSVVGFDDSPSASTSDPPLTTVAQPLRERGQAAGALVCALVQGGEVQAPELFGVELVIRASTARA